MESHVVKIKHTVRLWDKANVFIYVCKRHGTASNRACPCTCLKNLPAFEYDKPKTGGQTNGG
jgi:hypothetical protein